MSNINLTKGKATVVKTDKVTAVFAPIRNLGEEERFENGRPPRMASDLDMLTSVMREAEAKAKKVHQLMRIAEAVEAKLDAARANVEMAQKEAHEAALKFKSLAYDRSLFWHNL